MWVRARLWRFAGWQVFSVDSFKGFDDSVFAAFEERKWSSNMFNIERMKVSELLNRLGDRVESRLAASDVVFARAVSPHIPSVFNGRRVSEMALYFSRTEEQKRAVAPVLDRKVGLPEQLSDSGEYHRHGFLGVLVRQDRIDVGLMIHSRAWLDVMNLLNRCRERDEETARLVRMLHLMPRDAVVRVAPDKMIPASRFDESMIPVLEEAVMNEQFTFFVGFSYKADDPVVRQASFADQAADQIAGLLDMWKFCAWKPTSNYLGTSSAAPSAGQAQAVVMNDGHVVDFSKGSRVKVTAGPFAGRVGVVSELDSKGTVKILIGRVTVRTESHQVQPA